MTVYSDLKYNIAKFKPMIKCLKREFSEKSENCSKSDF